MSQCLLWVKRRRTHRTNGCPLYPQERTCAAQPAMSAKGQKRTLCLFDHLVGAREQCWGYGQADGFGGLEVDDKLELGGLFGG